VWRLNLLTQIEAALDPFHAIPKAIYAKLGSGIRRSEIAQVPNDRTLSGFEVAKTDFDFAHVRPHIRHVSANCPEVLEQQIFDVIGHGFLCAAAW
jgi:hypothetical protein